MADDLHEYSEEEVELQLRFLFDLSDKGLPFLEGYYVRVWASVDFSKEDPHEVQAALTFGWGSGSFLRNLALMLYAQLTQYDLHHESFRAAFQLAFHLADDPSQLLACLVNNDNVLWKLTEEFLEFGCCLSLHQCEDVVSTIMNRTPRSLLSSDLKERMRRFFPELIQMHEDSDGLPPHIQYYCTDKAKICRMIEWVEMSLDEDEGKRPLAQIAKHIKPAKQPQQ